MHVLGVDDVLHGYRESRERAWIALGIGSLCPRHRLLRVEIGPGVNGGIARLHPIKARTVPDVPAVPAFALRIVTEPLVVAVPLPLKSSSWPPVTLPPTPDAISSWPPWPPVVLLP